MSRTIDLVGLTPIKKLFTIPIKGIVLQFLNRLCIFNA